MSNWEKWLGSASKEPIKRRQFEGEEAAHANKRVKQKRKRPHVDDKQWLAFSEEDY